jgi:hypothetical protein
LCYDIPFREWCAFPSSLFGNSECFGNIANHRRNRNKGDLLPQGHSCLQVIQLSDSPSLHYLTPLSCRCKVFAVMFARWDRNSFDSLNRERKEDVTGSADLTLSMKGVDQSSKYGPHVSTVDITEFDYDTMTRYFI